MEICDFTFHRPSTLAEACELGRSLGEKGRFFAGGTELLIDFRYLRDTAEHLITLQDVPGLDAIVANEDGLHIGAMATLSQVAESPEVAARFPALAEAVLSMAGEQIRNQATIGGNFCRAVSCADTPPVCIVGEASLQIVGPDGARSLPAEDFFTGPRQTVLAPDEILEKVTIPTQSFSSGASYQRFSLRRGQALAVASVAARLVLDDDKIDDARVALGAVAPTPLFVPRCGEVLRGKAPGKVAFTEAAEIAATEAAPICDLRGSDEYRRELVETLTVRALEEAAARAADAGGRT